MTDIHCHLLFGVDDGPETMEESARMLRYAKEQGIRRIIATPHYSHEDMAIKALEEVQQYRAIGTTEECRAAVEKQMAKKPINPDDEYGTFQCPNCNGLIFTVDRFETHKHCLLCGQLLDWSDEE